MNRTTIYKYGKNENLVSSETTSNLEPNRNEKYVYAYKSDEMIKSKRFNHKNELESETKFKYTYDEYDNWIEKLCYEDGRLTIMVKRQFEYK